MCVLFLTYKIYISIGKICTHLLVFTRFCRDEGAARRKRSLAERVVWERRAPASAHGARQLLFYAFVQADQSDAVF